MPHFLLTCSCGHQSSLTKGHFFLPNRLSLGPSLLFHWGPGFQHNSLCRMPHPSHRTSPGSLCPPPTLMLPSHPKPKLSLRSANSAFKFPILFLPTVLLWFLYAHLCPASPFIWLSVSLEQNLGLPGPSRLKDPQQVLWCPLSNSVLCLAGPEDMVSFSQ